LDGSLERDGVVILKTQCLKSLNNAGGSFYKFWTSFSYVNMDRTNNYTIQNESSYSTAFTCIGRTLVLGGSLIGSVWKMKTKGVTYIESFLQSHISWLPVYFFRHAQLFF
jgi:hypothetical protein